MWARGSEVPYDFWADHEQLDHISTKARCLVGASKGYVVSSLHCLSHVSGLMTHRSGSNPGQTRWIRLMALVDLTPDLGLFRNDATIRMS